MASSLDNCARQFLYLVHDRVPSKKISLPKAWKTLRFSSAEELISWLEGAQKNNERALIIVQEAVYQTMLIAVKKKMSQDLSVNFGFLVLTSHAQDFVLESKSFMDFLDAINENDFYKNAEYLCLRSVRQLLTNQERGKSRVGQQTLEQLNEIFIALSAERNPERLFTSILASGLSIGEADGGLLYMVEEKDGELYFNFKISGSPDSRVERCNLKVIESSICGYSVLTGKLLSIQSSDALKPFSLPQYQKTVDYPDDAPLSLLTIPFKNSRNEIIAVLQLAKKNAASKEESRVFEVGDESLLTSFATQAAIFLENVDLYADIQRLFDGFVKASIAAIESRDPSTGGHSERVAKMTVGLARATTDCNTGIYRSVKFREEEIRELEYAALLHDFGKIGVREEVLVKAKKLYPYQLESIRDRIKICRAAVKIEFLEAQLRSGKSQPEKAFQERLKEIDTYWEIVLSANEPTILKKENLETLERIRREQLLLPDGSFIELLSDEEYQALAITQGSLTDSERLEVESHVRHTYQFLKMIPWTKDFKHLTEIAYCHHEKLDGTGYPRGLSSHEIPLQSKIMTIADIYDALTAADRWYKEALPVERALDILRAETNQGKIDPVLFEIFVERKIYQLTQPRELHKVA